MKVRYHAAIGVVFLVLGGLMLVLALAAAALVLVAALYLGLGVYFLISPYFWVRDSEITLGRRTFEYQALRVEGRKVFAVAGNGRRTKVPIKKWLARRDDWRATIEG